MARKYCPQLNRHGKKRAAPGARTGEPTICIYLLS